MATTKTTHLTVRLPVAVANAIEADADFHNLPVGTFLRELLTRHYSLPAAARKSNGSVRKSDGNGLTWEELDE